MPLIRLDPSQVRTDFYRAYICDKNRKRRLPWLRLQTNVLIGPDPLENEEDSRPQFPAILDTGSAFTVFPRSIWEDFQDQIVRLSFDGPGEDRMRIAGHELSVFIGTIHFAAIDLQGRLLPAVPVVSLFQEDNQPFKKLLLGMWGGFLDGRQLQRLPNIRAYDHDSLEKEVFGQEWWLSD